MRRQLARAAQFLRLRHLAMRRASATDPDPMARAYDEIAAMFRKIRDEGNA